ncbi:glycosyltransferase [bacterium]|nr:MAG: glycosyltransferase [bacterium]
MDKAVIYFVQNIDSGLVKPQLAQIIGNDKAIEVYTDLLKHTSVELSRVKADRFIFYSDDITVNDELFPEEDFIYELQSGNTLAEKMLHAFDSLFNMGYKEVVLVHRDCPELTFDIINSAFNELIDHDVIIGSTRKGTTYLLGLKEVSFTYFNHKNWDSETIFDELLDELINQQKIWYELPILTDIDTEEDLQVNRVKQFYRRIVDQASLA